MRITVIIGALMAIANCSFEKYFSFDETAIIQFKNDDDEPCKIDKDCPRWPYRICDNFDDKEI